MQTAVQKAQNDRQKVIQELNELQGTVLMKQMDNVKAKSSLNQQECSLERLKAVLVDTEKSYDDLCSLYNSQFEQLVETIDSSTTRL
jgi:hypothetical protein